MSIENKSKSTSNIHIILFGYWCVLVAWQSVGTSANRSGMDLVIKIGLIAVLALYVFLHSNRYVGINLLYLLVFSGCLCVPLVMKETFSLNILISYVFPCLFLFLTFVLGNRFEINRQQLLTFLHGIILAVAYMAVYAILFCGDQFVRAFSISSAYGNELTSFLISNHEYGLYLIGGITGCLICLVFKQSAPVKAKLPYFAALALFIPNLILTFSRTSLMGMACILLVYIVLSRRNKLKRYLIVALTVGTAAIWFIPALNTFFMRIILKNNATAGRDVLYQLAVDYFREGTIAEKLFGHGITQSRRFFEDTTSHGSVHNAYLQILVYFGLSVVLVLVIFLATQMVANLKLIRRSRFWGTILAAVLFMNLAVMFTNTAYIFNSSIDSYFLTVFAIIVPKYVRNSICAGTFDVVGDG